jgi:hypothetical protein
MNVPRDVLLEVFSHIPERFLLSLFLVCREWSQAAKIRYPISKYGPVFFERACKSADKERVIRLLQNSQINPIIIHKRKLDLTKEYRCLFDLLKGAALFGWDDVTDVVLPFVDLSEQQERVLRVYGSLPK